MIPLQILWPYLLNEHGRSVWAAHLHDPLRSTDLWRRLEEGTAEARCDAAVMFHLRTAPPVPTPPCPPYLCGPRRDLALWSEDVAPRAEHLCWWQDDLCASLYAHRAVRAYVQGLEGLAAADRGAWEAGLVDRFDALWLLGDLGRTTGAAGYRFGTSGKPVLWAPSYGEPFQPAQVTATYDGGMHYAVRGVP